MHVNRVSGRLEGVNWHDSPNFDERPVAQDISLLVIHNISLPPGAFGSDDILAFFANQLDPTKHPYFATICHLKVSAHFFINRAGVIWQLVPLTHRAWHAGQSSFAGRERCNDFSIGIELEGTDTTPFTDAQYQQLTAVSAAIMQAYPNITLDRITGHSDIAPVRKTDPGPLFDWSRYLASLKAGNLNDIDS